MKAMMKSIVLEKLSSRTSSGSFLSEAVARSGRRRSKIIVCEILWTSGDDWRYDFE